MWTQAAQTCVLVVSVLVGCPALCQAETPIGPGVHRDDIRGRMDVLPEGDPATDTLRFALPALDSASELAGRSGQLRAKHIDSEEPPGSRLRGGRPDLRSKTPARVRASGGSGSVNSRCLIRAGRWRKERPLTARVMGTTLMDEPARQRTSHRPALNPADSGKCFISGGLRRSPIRCSRALRRLGS
jgi:hypothetical protein